MPTLALRLVRPLMLIALLGWTAAIADAQQPPAAPVQKAVAPLTQAERARYIGVYETETPDGMMRINIYESGERLMGRPENDDDEPSPLTPLGDHRFAPDLLEGAIITFTVENDRATRFAIAFPDERGTIVAIRKP